MAGTAPNAAIGGWPGRRLLASRSADGCAIITALGRWFTLFLTAAAETDHSTSLVRAAVFRNSDSSAGLTPWQPAATRSAQSR